MITYRTLFSVATLAYSTLAPLPDEPTLEERLESLAQTLEEARVDAHVPGMSVAVVKDGEVVFAQGFGWADLEDERPADAETVYAVGSTTKAFTATLMGMLVDEGKLEWDDPVTDYLPDFDLAVRSEDADAECTLRDLLSHRHGFARMSLLWLSKEVTREDILETAAQAEPFDDFRENFHYCNVTYLAAGEAAGAADGTTWETLMRERILGPLGMGSSTLTAAEAREDPRLASGYLWRDELGEYEELGFLSIDNIGPAGSLNANVLDMAQWLRFQLGEGEVGDLRLIDPERVRETWRPQIPMGGGAAYGMGWMLRDWKGRRVVEHGGNIGGFSAQVGLLPEEGLGFVLLSNLGASTLQQSALPLVFEALLGAQEETSVTPVAAAAPQELGYDDFAGVYLANFANFRDERFEVLAREDGLALHIPSQQVFELKDPDGEGKWTFALTDQIAVSFGRDEEGTVTSLTVHQSGFAFEVPREGVELRPALTADELERHLGTYRHDSGKAVEIAESGGGLVFVNGAEMLPIEAPDETGLAPMRAREELSVTFLYDERDMAEALAFRRPGREPKTFVREGRGAGASLPTLPEVLDLGGRLERAAHWAKAEGILVGEVRVLQAGLRGTVTQGFAAEAASYQTLDFGKFGQVSRVVRAGAGESRDLLRGHRQLKGQELVQARLEHPASLHGDWREHYDGVAILRNEDLDGRATHVLRLTKEGLPPRSLWLDAETGDVLRLDYLAVEGPLKIPVSVRYSDYREVEGLRLPMRSEAENPGSGRTVTTFSRLELGASPEGAWRLGEDED